MTQKEFIVTIILGILVTLIILFSVIALIAYTKRKDQYERDGMTYIRVVNGLYINFEMILLLILILACVVVALIMTTKIDDTIIKLYYKTP